MHLDPPRWDPEQLEADRLAAITKFREERLQEPLEQYLEAFDTYRRALEDLLEATVDLTDLSTARLEILTDPALLEALRYTAGPPISEDDLKVLADASLAPSKLRADRDMGQRVIETILTALDHRRFPWLVEGREPNEDERTAAVLASAALMATQRLSTSRRSESKTSQEQSVRDALLDAGFEEVPTRRIETLAQAPNEGQFCGESQFGSRKADFVIGLWDGRTMPLECKVSNSSTNSIKRLNNDAAVKASRWIEEFGTIQTVPAAVLSGVFKRRNLEAAQEVGLTIFWAYKLDALLEWIERTRSDP
ncbi:MAG: XamI family restriction endonuclease [Thermoleophilaceae bacterium]|nr:XamI family restriction endonuclease [Thermoleophilaceae bacterium]